MCSQRTALFVYLIGGRMVFALHLHERGLSCAFPKVLAHAGEAAQPLAGASCLNLELLSARSAILTA